MGAAVSTRSSFKEHEAYEAWTLDAVKNVAAPAPAVLCFRTLDATLRSSRKLAGKTVVSTRVDRKDFFAIFNGFDFVLPSGGFATLPVNEFNRFLEHDEKAATNGHNTIAIRRPMLLKLGEAEILEIIKAAWKQMTAAAAEAGGDAAKDEVTLQELKDWCQTDLGRRGMLTKMFSGNVRGTVAQMAIAEYKQRRPERKFGGGASMRFERALKKNGKTQMAAKRQDDNLRALRKKRRAASPTIPRDSTEKGGRKNAISLEQLSDVLFARFPDLEDGKSFRRALAVFDVDGDGWIDFDEFILALKRMDKDDDPTKQLKFIFDMFDESRDGEVELWEVSDAIEDHRKDIADMAKYCRGLAASLDVNGDDKINITEFRQSLKKEKVFINFCYEGLAPVHPTTNACVKAIAEFRARMIDAEDAGARVGADTPRTSSFVAVAPALRPDGTVMKPKLIQSGHEKHNPGAIHVDVLAEETVSVEQVTGHLDRMEEQLTNDMEYLLFSFDEWDKDHSGSVTQDELVEYVMAEPGSCACSSASSSFKKAGAGDPLDGAAAEEARRLVARPVGLAVALVEVGLEQRGRERAAREGHEAEAEEEGHRGHVGDGHGRVGAHEGAELARRRRRAVARRPDAPGKSTAGMTNVVTATPKTMTARSST
ncbi:protein phosphatase 3 [Aureococcus anophagefferens]|nr:protein phosphatase 3 [Aureococcus anophagefferens]